MCAGFDLKTEKYIYSVKKLSVCCSLCVKEGCVFGRSVFVVLKGEHDMPLDKLANELRGMVKTRISSFAQPDMILVWLLTWLPS